MSYRYLSYTVAIFILSSKFGRNVYITFHVSQQIQK